jgi:hypothetical protein
LIFHRLNSKDGDGTFAAIADVIASMEGFEEQVMQRSYYTFLEHEDMRKPMPVRRLPSVNWEQ